MVVDLCKQGRHRQSRTVLKYLDQVASDWALGLEVPDVGLALYLTWDKAGCRLPQELRKKYQGSFPSKLTRSG